MLPSESHDQLFAVERSKNFWGRFRKKTSTAWVEDSFTFYKPHGRQIALPGSADHVGSSLSPTSVLLFFLLILIVMSVMIGRLMQLQIVHGQEYFTRAEQNRERVNAIPSERGLIFDRYGRQLTKNIPKLSLVLVPQNVPRTVLERERVIRKIADITALDPKDIRYNIVHGIPTVLEDDIAYDMALMLQIDRADLPGVDIVQGSKRLYLHDVGLTESESVTSSAMTLSHLLGYEGKINDVEYRALVGKGYLQTDQIGKSGIEKTYESVLRGVYGTRRREVDFLERQQKVIAETPPIPGDHVYMAIDSAMQAKMEDILRRTLKQYGKKRAAAVALDPRTGEVLAMVSLPTFDNNDFSGGIAPAVYAKYMNDPDTPLFNRAIAGMYPSGSTIKPAVAAAALQERIITPQTTFLSTGGLRVSSWFFPDWLSGGHGVTDVRKSLAWSVNTFYYYLGGGYGTFTGLGVDTMTAYLQRFGFGSKLGIDLPGERSGFLPSKEWKEETKKERWYIGDTYNLSIGQGDLLVTPLQIASLTATVANGGTLYGPRVVRGIQHVGEQEIQDTSPIILRDRVIDDVYLRVVRAGMRDCVTTGSCRRLSTVPGSIAGKTGTAQWSNNKDPHAWFTSFAPYDNPEIVFTVIIEEGEGGSTAAVPAAYEFYNWWSTYRHEVGA